MLITRFVNMVFFRRVAIQLSLSLSLLTFLVFEYGNDKCRNRYRYQSRLGLTVPNPVWFRCPTILPGPVYTIAFRF